MEEGLIQLLQRFEERIAKLEKVQCLVLKILNDSL